MVLFLRFRHAEDRRWGTAVMGTYSRDEDQWTAHRAWMSTGFSPDPIARPDDLRHLGGRAIGATGRSRTPQPTPGYPAMIVHGRVDPAVTHLVVVQEGREDRRPLDSRFGAWVVCTGQASPFQVIALDENGSELGRLEGSIPPEDPFYFPAGSD